MEVDVSILGTLDHEQIRVAVEILKEMGGRRNEPLRHEEPSAELYGIVSRVESANNY